ncbi:MAG: LysR family transcriptional regulator [Candidatus Dactylopiibacterium carminicum]|uniref:LysR family transcriptional regulator n=1 Tax=Candidatus Dactylopiibacterium carminicum TaxID=857335 RepID=A0A272ERQ6_9RHOO|nr:MAG: LysR family transcriptional regulator [Candidatus Dactylopiibacterium carminicum]
MQQFHCQFRTNTFTFPQRSPSAGSLPEAPVMSLQYLRIFNYIDAIARSGSIRKAAEGLFITPSALDRRLQDLEEDLDATLFERHARGMRPTAAGELFLKHARQQRADYERLRTEIAQLRGLHRGTVSIAASQALAFSLFPDIITRFRQANPGITFTVRICDHGSAIQALRSFEADLALVYNAQPSADINQLLEVEQRLCAVMAADHPLLQQPGLRMRDCLRYPLALPDSSLGGRMLLEAFFARSSLTPNVVLESNSFEMLRNFVRGSDAVSFQIQVGTALARAQDGVTARHIDDRGLGTRPLTLAQLKGRHLPLPAMRFAQVLREVLAGDEAQA